MTDISLGSVVLYGFGTVFLGLILLILVTKLTGAIIGGSADKKPAKEKRAVAAKEESVPIKDRGAFIAAVAAAVSQCMGVEVSGIRILSVKKVQTGGDHNA